MEELKVCVLFRFAKRTGKVDTVMTALGSAALKMWALTNTKSSQKTIVMERQSGKVVCLVVGCKDGFPNVKRAGKDCDLGKCSDYGIEIGVLQSITDDRFAEEGGV